MDTLEYKQQSRWKRRVVLLCVLFAYLALILVQTFPFVLHIGDSFAGPSTLDQKIFLWNAWWFSYAVDHHQSLLHTQHMLYPAGVSLVYQSHTYVHDFMTFVLHRFFPLLLSFNIVTILFLAFAAFGTFLLARKVSQNMLGSLIAGALFVSSAYVLTRLSGHLDLVAVWPIPWFFYFFLRTFESKKLRDAFGLGLVFGLSLLNGFYYPVFILLFAVFSFVYLLFVAPWKHMLRFLKLLCVAALVAVILFLPLLPSDLKSLGMLSSFQNEGFGASPDTFLAPSIFNTFYGFLTHQHITLNEIAVGGVIEKALFIGLLPFLCFVAALFIAFRKQKTFMSSPMRTERFWVLFLFLAVLLSLGFVILIGNIGIFLPAHFLAKIPFISGARIPARFGIMVEFSVVIIVALCFKRLQSYLREKYPRYGKLILGIIALLFLAETASFPYPISKAEKYVTTPELASIQGGVINIPEFVRDGTRQITDVYYGENFLYQTVHEKPMIGAYLSRINPDQMDQQAAIPGLQRFFYTELLDSPLSTEELQNIRETLSSMNIQAAILFKHRLTSAEYAAAVGIMAALHATPILSDDVVHVFLFNKE